jgi:hypothetical protein
VWTESSPVKRKSLIHKIVEHDDVFRDLLSAHVREPVRLEMNAAPKQQGELLRLRAVTARSRTHRDVVWREQAVDGDRISALLCGPIALLEIHYARFLSYKPRTDIA